jgi:hypothetical protein
LHQIQVLAFRAPSGKSQGGIHVSAEASSLSVDLGRDCVALIPAPAFAADPILIRVPPAQSGPVGVADRADAGNAGGRY